MRLKERFLKEGLDSFSEVQVLELALFYCIPRKDTNPIAHALLEHFGGLSQVLHLTQPGERCDLVFYENTAVDGEHILLWGQKPAGWGGWYTLSRLTLNYYVLLAALSAAGLGLLWLLLRKKQAGRVFMYLSVLFLCWLAGHFLIVGGSRVDYYAVTFCFSLICCTAAALFGAFCSALALVRLQRQARPFCPAKPQRHGSLRAAAVRCISIPVCPCGKICGWPRWTSPPAPGQCPRRTGPLRSAEHPRPCPG